MKEALRRESQATSAKLRAERSDREGLQEQLEGAQADLDSTRKSLAEVQQMAVEGKASIERKEK